MRLIDADALIELWKGCTFNGDITLIIANAPTIELERKTGEWIPFETDLSGIHGKFVRCSVCGKTRPIKVFSDEGFKFNFCPNCGADMREGQDERHD